MVICPVCEHAQDVGGECAVCGKPFGAAQGTNGPVARLPDLEPTRLEASPAPLVEAIQDLEPTVREAAGVAAAPEEPAHWLERTSVPVEGETLDPFALALCRYCRTPASPGDVFCARCGLKLAVYTREAPEESSGAVRRCRFCGADSAGGSCAACGMRF
jgi:hypothetical protein